jgi:hypothetical protein
MSTGGFELAKVKEYTAQQEKTDKETKAGRFFNPASNKGRL